MGLEPRTGSTVFDRPWTGGVANQALDLFQISHRPFKVNIGAVVILVVLPQLLEDPYNFVGEGTDLIYLQEICF